MPSALQRRSFESLLMDTVCILTIQVRTHTSTSTSTSTILVQALVRYCIDFDCEQICRTSKECRSTLGICTGIGNNNKSQLQLQHYNKHKSTNAVIVIGNNNRYCLSVLLLLSLSRTQNQQCNTSTGTSGVQYTKTTKTRYKDAILRRRNTSTDTRGVLYSKTMNTPVANRPVPAAVINSQQIACKPLVAAAILNTNCPPA